MTDVIKHWSLQIYVHPQRNEELGLPVGTPTDSAAQPEGNGIKTPWRTPPPTFSEVKTPATSIPASGWQDVCGPSSEGNPFPPLLSPHFLALVLHYADTVTSLSQIFPSFSSLREESFTDVLYLLKIYVMTHRSRGDGRFD